MAQGPWNTQVRPGGGTRLPWDDIAINIVGTGGISATNPNPAGITVDVPWDCKIIAWSVTSDVSGSISVDILRINKNNPPTASIVSSSGNYPSLSSQLYNSGYPTNWTSVTLKQGDIIGFLVNSATSVSQVTVTLRVEY